jgi:dihydrofolate reductase
MNWMTKLAILFGRKKFEEFAQANPQLPDDALAVANTLDTYPTRGAAALIAGSLAHAINWDRRDG